MNNPIAALPGNDYRIQRICECYEVRLSTLKMEREEEAKQSR